MRQIQRAAKILIRRRTDGRYLILTCSVWPENPRRSQQPDLPGGLVEPHERIEDGLVREIHEETGLQIAFEDLQLGYSLTYDDGGTSTNFLCYVAEVEGSEEIALSWEHESYEWLTFTQLTALDIRPPYRAIFTHLSNTELIY